MASTTPGKVVLPQLTAFCARLQLHAGVLVDTHSKLRVDCGKLLTGIHARSKRRVPLLLKAAGWREHRQWSLWDCTAGLGRDAVEAASWQCRVHAMEQHPLLWLGLHSSLAAHLPDLPCQAHHMNSVLACLRVSQAARDAYQAWGMALPEGTPSPSTALQAQPECIMLDPMFHPKTKTAAVKKDAQMLQLAAAQWAVHVAARACMAGGATLQPAGLQAARELCEVPPAAFTTVDTQRAVAACVHALMPAGMPAPTSSPLSDEHMLVLCLLTATQRVIVKRAHSAPPLDITVSSGLGADPIAHIAPDFVVQGTSVRWDVYQSAAHAAKLQQIQAARFD